MAGSMNEAMEKAKTKLEAKPTNLILRVPTIHKVETIAIKVIDKAVVEARQYIAAIPDHMTDLIKRIRGIQTASSEEKTIRSKELKDLEDEVLAHLNSGEELLASAARQAYAMAMVSTLPADKRLVIETIKGNGNSRLPGLLELKLLEPAGDDAKNAITLKVFGYTYKVSGGQRDFAIRLIKTLAEGAANAAKAAREYYRGEVAALRAQATISVAELLVRRQGQALLNVPDDKVGGKFLPGGILLAESDGRVIKVLKACGHFSHIMTEIAEAGVFVPIESLSRERLELTKRLDAFWRVRILHAVLRRGIAEARAGMQKETV